MTITFRLDDGTGIAVATASGALRREDALEAARRWWQLPGWSGECAVWDFRNSQFDVSAGDVQQVARFIIERQPENPPRKVAFVTARDVDFGMARMFEAYRDDERTAFRVFRDLDEAMAWAATREPDRDGGSSGRTRA